MSDHVCEVTIILRDTMPRIGEAKLTYTGRCSCGRVCHVHVRGSGQASTLQAEWELWPDEAIIKTAPARA